MNRRFLAVWKIFRFGMASRVGSSRSASRAILQTIGIESLEQRLALAVPSLVLDIVPGGIGSQGGGYGSSVPVSLTEFKNAVYFAASDSSAARGIWKTDGTAAGTLMVASIRPQREGPWYAKDTISQLTASGDYLFFREIQGSSLSSPSTKLWRTDGTSSGTILLRDFGAQIANLTDVDGELFFTVRTGNTSEEIWRSDGTELGTVRLGVFASVSPSRNSSNLNAPETFQRFASIGGDIFFTAQQVPNGPAALLKWNSAAQSFQTLHERVSPYSLTLADGKLLYAVGVLQSGIAGPTELWQTDGTAAGTARVATMSEWGYGIHGIVHLGGVTYVGAVGPRLGLPGKVMTVTGGSFATVYETQRASLSQLVVRSWGRDICIVERDTNQAASFSRLSTVSLAVTRLCDFRSWGGSGGDGDVFNDQDYVVASNGRLYFPASPAVSSIFSSSATELWESDGSVAGTRALDVTPEFSSSPRHLAAFRGDIFYGASSTTTGVELWTLPLRSATQPPTAPTAVSALLTATAGTVAVSWTNPTSPGGSAITGYLVQYSVDDGATWLPSVGVSASASPATVSGLILGTRYVFRVGAENANGVTWSLASQPLIPLGPAAAPAITGISAADGSLSLSWSVPSDTGGGPIIDYRIEYSGDGGASWADHPHASSLATHGTVTGLRNGIPYLARVSAVTAYGAGTPSAAAGPVTPVGLPSSPLNVTGVPGDQAVLLSWSAPVTDGGLPIKDYVISYSSDDTSYTVLNDGIAAVTTATVSGLTNGISYTFRVAAVNTGGQAGPAGQSAPIRPFAPLAAPLGLWAVADDRQVALSWWSSEVAPNFRGYVVQFRVDSSTAPWRTFVDGILTSQVVVTGLINGIQYAFRVAAVSSDGPSAYANPVVAVPLALPVAPPTAVRGSGRFGRITLRWDAPATAFVFPGSRYVVQYRVATSRVVWRTLVVQPTSANTVITGLRNRLGYFFRVAMTRGAEIGPWSESSARVRPF